MKKAIFLFLMLFSQSGFATEFNCIDEIGLCLGDNHYELPKDKFKHSFMVFKHGTCYDSQALYVDYQSETDPYSIQYGYLTETGEIFTIYYRLPLPLGDNPKKTILKYYKKYNRFFSKHKIEARPNMLPRMIYNGGGMHSTIQIIKSSKFDNNYLWFYFKNTGLVKQLTKQYCN